MKLDAYLRPYVKFDPAKKAHRELYAEFIKSGSWGHCPVRFTLDEECNNLAAALQRKLAEFYIAREFKARAKS